MGAALGPGVAQADEKLVRSQGRGPRSGDNHVRIPDYRIRLTLDLLVPGLLPPADAPEAMRTARFPALERWLARARPSREAARGTRGWLAAAFELGSPPPYAALALEGEGLGRPGAWLRADPVHLAVGQDAVALRDASLLAVTREESNALVDALGTHFKADGLNFNSPAPDRWYVQVPPGEVPVTTALDDALGRNVFGLLPRGSGALNWAGALTETQMLFASHAVNQEREARGQPTINGVWFWGEGVLPETLARPYAAIEGGDEFVRGFARISGAGTVIENGGGLAILDGAARALVRGDAAGWLEAVTALERDWFARMGALVSRHGAVRVIVPGHADTQVFTLDSSARWRWLRRARPLAGHA